MCNLKSAIILKERIYCPLNHNHHSQMLEELNIKDTSCFPNFVRVEMTPIDYDIFNHDLTNWKLIVDQDFKPEWFDFNECEKRMKIQIMETCQLLEPQQAQV